MNLQSIYEWILLNIATLLSLAVIIGVIVLAAILNVWMTNDKDEKPTNLENNIRNISVSEVINEFKKNPIRAESLYAKGLYNISGKIVKMSKGFCNEYFITIYEGERDIVCEVSRDTVLKFDVEQTVPIEKLKLDNVTDYCIQFVEK